MNLKSLPDQILLTQTKTAVKHEKDATLSVLRHLREVERRQLFAKNHSSLFTYCTDELGYEPGAAHVRIAAMRLLREIPELAHKIESGALSLTVMAQAQTFFKKERTINEQDKLKIIASLEGKSSRQVQRELIESTDTPLIHLKEKMRPISKNLTELRLVVDDELLEQINALKALLAHSIPNASFTQVIAYAVNAQATQLKPKPPKQIPTPLPQQSAPQKTLSPTQTPFAPEGTPQQRQIRPISLAETRRQVWHRDKGRCTFPINPKTQQTCDSTFALEYDHIHPKALGGFFSTANLRLRCRIHNRLHAIEKFGPEKISRHVPSMR